MATLTLTIDPELLEAAKREAERRQITLDQFVSETLARTTKSRLTDADKNDLIQMMKDGVLGDLGKLPTREEIYAERTQWPRS
jgi:hypothetical protein